MEIFIFLFPAISRVGIQAEYFPFFKHIFVKIQAMKFKIFENKWFFLVTANISSCQHLCSNYFNSSWWVTPATQYLDTPGLNNIQNNFPRTSLEHYDNSESRTIGYYLIRLDVCRGGDDPVIGVVGSSSYLSCNMTPPTLTDKVYN